MTRSRAIASLAPIALTELDAVAALRTRKDRKYLVPAAEVEGLVAGAGSRSRVLEIDGLRTFRYESVYFDTPDFDCYRAAARRRPRRSKVRTRSYLDSAVAFLEVKARQGRGLTVKHRLAYGLSDRHRITPEGLAFLEAVSSVGPLADRLRPALKTRYRRTTLLAEDEASRVTIDECLECVAPAGALVRLDSVVLIETKTASRPCEFDRMLWASGHRPVKVSKYGTGLAALDPSLPANKWHRVLRDYFTGRPQTVLAVAPSLPSPDHPLCVAAAQ
jgi:hypothetical protein